MNKPQYEHPVTFREKFWFSITYIPLCAVLASLLRMAGAPETVSIALATTALVIAFAVKIVLPHERHSGDRAPRR